MQNEDVGHLFEIYEFQGGHSRALSQMQSPSEREWGTGGPPRPYALELALVEATGEWRMCAWVCGVLSAPHATRLEG